jgi:MFS family permease
VTPRPAKNGGRLLGLHAADDSRTSAGIGGTFAALSIVPYRFLWASMLASFAGMQMQMIARGYLAYKLSHSAGSIALITLAWGIPMLLFSLVGGAIADRLERRKLMIASQAATASVALTIALLVQTGMINMTYLFVAGLVQGTIFSFAGPARQSFIPEIVPEERLMNAIALNNAGMNLTRIGGPSLAGALIGISWIDVQGVFFLQALLNGVALTLLFFLPMPGKRQGAFSGPQGAGQRHRNSITRDLVDGLRYARRSPVLLTLLMMGIVPMLIGSSYQSFLPVFAREVFGDGTSGNASGLGLMSTMTGVGAIFGSLAVASLATFPRRTMLQLIAGVGFGLSMAFFAVQHEFLIAIVALVCLGVMSDFFASMNATLVVSASDPDYYGRVMSINMMTFSLMPLGVLPAGYLADWIGHVEVGSLDLIGVQVTTFGAGMLITLFMFAVTIFNPSYRRLEQDDIRRSAAEAAGRLEPVAPLVEAPAGSRRGGA